MAHFSLAPGQTSTAVRHRTVEEIWYVLSGQGEMWRQQDEQTEVVQLQLGDCITIPTGTAFQYRTIGDEPLTAVGTTMPPWPGHEEAEEVTGIWPAPSLQ